MKRAHDYRLRHLEAEAATKQASADQVTLEEWRAWHATGEQPRRWIGNATIQAWVQQALERQRQADETVSLFDEVDHEASSAASAGA